MDFFQMKKKVECPRCGIDLAIMTYSEAKTKIKSSPARRGNLILQNLEDSDKVAVCEKCNHIYKSVALDISPDDIQVFDGMKFLKETDKNFIKREDM